MQTPAHSPELSPTKRALLALQQLQAKLADLESAQQEPIAIVGMGCRFPGAENLAAFWQLLQQQQDAITEIPPDRWDLGKYYAADPGQPGTMQTQHGGFVPHLFEFDAPFFRIAPREAISLDPQQRLLLEVSWEALEHAGIAADQLLGSPTGVFIGICSIDYWQRLLARHPSEIDAYLSTGNTHSLAAGRISYVLGCTGPSLAIDTACSSSLVALHSACQSLRNRECDLALAGGVNRILEPATSINFSQARMLSASGRCRSFDARADGFVRSEGCGMVVLRRLRDAVTQGDRIEAVILGSAVNHDGRSSGLTVPNGLAQQALIRQALQQSRISPAQVDYIETHGTGTALGDPIEANALGAVFNSDRSAANPLMLGSVKTNIGHTEAAAGIAGVIKTVLALQHQTIPANLHFQTPNPQINWQELQIKVPTHPVAWKIRNTPRIAGVSAFGFNGTNGHVIIANTPLETLESTPITPEPPPYLLTLSAKTETALHQLVLKYCDFLTTTPNLCLADLCYTSRVGRVHFNHRIAILTHSLPDLQQKLTLIADGILPPDTLKAQIPPASPSPTPPLIHSPHSLAQAYIQGAISNWHSIEPTQRRKIPLPTYPFQRQHYGIERT
jgi:acyl transferase domain-containing protein